MKNLLKAAAAVGVLALGLSGCATITEGKTATLAVNTVPVDGAKCTLKNGVGTWYLTTPGSADVHKSKTALDITCTKDGYEDAHQILRSRFEPMTAGNLILGGAIGIGVDAASGAMYHYDKSVQVNLLPVGATPVMDAPVTDTPAPAAPAKPTS